MTDNNNFSRRQFLGTTSSATLTKLMGLGGPAIAALAGCAESGQTNNSEFQTLSTLEAADVAAIAARIMPSDETPGASEAGVVYFIDAALAGEMVEQKSLLATGLADLNASIGASDRFADLTPEQQDIQLTAIEDSPFFGFLWAMTMYGMFALPSYGGNKDYVGWELLGFEGQRGAWSYPFGYYDQQAEEEESA